MNQLFLGDPHTKHDGIDRTGEGLARLFPGKKNKNDVVVARGQAVRAGAGGVPRRDAE